MKAVVISRKRENPMMRSEILSLFFQDLHRSLAQSLWWLPVVHCRKDIVKVMRNYFRPISEVEDLIFPFSPGLQSHHILSFMINSEACMFQTVPHRSQRNLNGTGLGRATSPWRSSIYHRRERIEAPLVCFGLRAHWRRLIMGSMQLERCHRCTVLPRFTWKRLRRLHVILLPRTATCDT